MIPELRTEHLWPRPSSTIALFHFANLLIHIKMHMLHAHVLQSQHVLLPFLSSQPHGNGVPWCLFSPPFYTTSICISMPMSYLSIPLR